MFLHVLVFSFFFMSNHFHTSCLYSGCEIAGCEQCHDGGRGEGGETGERGGAD